MNERFMIDVNRIYMYSDHRLSLEDFKLQVRQGEIVGLLGPYRSGKSTALKVLATILPPTEGGGTIAGHDLVEDAASIRSLVGYLPYFLGVYDDMPVEEYLQFFARMHKVAPAEWAARRDAVLECAQLTEKRGDYVESLDREAKQRLCLCRTLIHDPPILLLDEPAAGLPIEQRVRMRELVGRIGQGRRTIVVCSNILTDLVGLCDRIGVMHEGRLIMIGEADEMRRRLSKGRLIELEVEGDPSHVQSRLSEHQAVDEVHVHEQFIIFTLDGNVTDPSTVMPAVNLDSDRIRRWREHEIRLEMIPSLPSPEPMS